MTLALLPIPFPPTLDSTKFVQFGREVKGVHPKDISANTEVFGEIEEALYRHEILLFRNVDLTPEEQYDLVKVFDPKADNYGHGNNKLKTATKSVLHYLTSVPSVPQIQVIGHGTIKDHEGIPEATFKHGHHATFHKTRIPVEDEQARGATRFYRWHMDAALYDFDPPKVTALYGIRVPQGPMQVVRYDDGTGDELPVTLGTTAFVSGKNMFDRLPMEWKSFAVRARARYAPHPFEWLRNAKAVSTGLGLVSEGLEVPTDELTKWEEGKVKVYPFVWKNPVTGNLHLQVHPMAIREILVDPISETLRDRATIFPEGKRIADIKEVRTILYEMQRPGIAPSLVYPHPWQEKDLVLFHNRGLMHSVVGLFADDQVRLFHQCNLASSDEPVGPSVEDIQHWA